MNKIQFNIQDNHFSSKLLSYDSKTGEFKEIEKYRTQWKIVDWFIKVYQYWFTNTNIHQVVKGITKELEQVDSKTNLFEYISYIRLFKKNVIDKHNSHLFGFQSVVKMDDLNNKFESYCEKLFADEKQISSNIVKEARDFFKSGFLDVNKENVKDLFNLSKRYNCNQLRRHIDEKLAESHLVDCSKVVKERVYDPQQTSDENDQLYFQTMKKEILEFVDLANFIHSVGLEKSCDAINRSKYCQVLSIPKAVFGQMDSENLKLVIQSAKNFKGSEFGNFCEQFIIHFFDAATNNILDYILFVSKPEPGCGQMDKEILKVFAHVAKNFKGSEVGDFCEQLIIKYFVDNAENNTDESLKQYYSDVNEDLWGSKYADLIKEQYYLPKMFSQLQTFLGLAVQSDLDKSKEIIFEKIIKQAALFYEPTRNDKHEKNKGDFCVQIKDYVRKHLTDVHNKHLNNETIALVYKIFDSKYWTEEESNNLFIYAFCPYLLKNSISKGLNSTGWTAEQLLDFYHLVEKFELSTNLPKNYVFEQDNFIRIVLNRFNNESEGIDSQEKLIEKYLPFRNKLLASFASHNDFLINDFNEKFFIDREKTAFNKQIFKIDDKTNLNSDVTLILPNGDKLFLHKKVLEISPYFQKLFKDSNSSEYKMDNLKNEEQTAFVDLMGSLYTHKYEMSKHNQFHLLQIAERYDFERLLPIKFSWQVHVNNTFDRRSFSYKGPIISLDDSIKFMNIAEQFNIHLSEKIIPYVLDTICTQFLHMLKAVNDVDERKIFLTKYASTLTHYSGEIIPQMLSFICETFKDLTLLGILWSGLGLNDESAKEIVKLQKLEKLSFQKFTKVSIASLKYVLENCPNLKTIIIEKYSTFKESLSEVKAFGEWLKVNRPDLEVGDISLNNEGKLEDDMKIEVKSKKEK